MYREYIDPEKLRMFTHIWRPVHCATYIGKHFRNNFHADQIHIDVAYCLDRYSLIDAPERNSNETTS